MTAINSTRRQFLKSTLGLGAGCATLESWLARAAETPEKIPVGLQLWAVRGEFTRDVPGTLKTVASFGYQGVEFWGYAGTPNVFQEYSAQELRKMLDDCGLQCCGIHLQVKAMEAGQVEQTVVNSRILGTHLLNVAAAKERMGSEEDIKSFATFLNEKLVELRPHHMRVGYHSHPFDFEKVNDRFPWEILFRQTDPEVNMQIDVGNILTGGGDPVALLKEFPGRTRSIHLKVHGEKTFESAYYQEVFRLCETTSKTEWYIVEETGEGGLGFYLPRKALEVLRGLGK